MTPSQMNVTRSKYTIVWLNLLNYITSISGIGWQIFPRWLAKDTKQIGHNLRERILLKLTLTNAISIDTSKTKDYYEYLFLFVYVWFSYAIYTIRTGQRKPNHNNILRKIVIGNFFFDKDIKITWRKTVLRCTALLILIPLHSNFRELL